LAPGRQNDGQLNELPGGWLVGVVRGSLVDAGWGAKLGFPALILDPDGGSIEVSVFESEALLDHWHRLDAFEGPGYRRVTVDVSTPEGVLPAQRVDVPMPLASCEVDVDRRWGRMGDQALRQTWAWTTDECALVRHAIVSHDTTTLHSAGSNFAIDPPPLTAAIMQDGRAVGGQMLTSWSAMPIRGTPGLFRFARIRTAHRSPALAGRVRRRPSINPPADPSRAHTRARPGRGSAARSNRWGWSQHPREVSRRQSPQARGGPPRCHRRGSRP